MEGFRGLAQQLYSNESRGGNGERGYSPFLTIWGFSIFNASSAPTVNPSSSLSSQNTKTSSYQDKQTKPAKIGFRSIHFTLRLGNYTSFPRVHHIFFRSFIVVMSNNIPFRNQELQRVVPMERSSWVLKQNSFKPRNPLDKENNPFPTSVHYSGRDPLDRQSTKLHVPAKINPFGLNGSWHKYESLAFLEGLESFGPGRWKKIARLVPTR